MRISSRFHWNMNVRLSINVCSQSVDLKSNFQIYFLPEKSSIAYLINRMWILIINFNKKCYSIMQFSNKPIDLICKNFYSQKECERKGLLLRTFRSLKGGHIVHGNVQRNDHWPVWNINIIVIYAKAVIKTNAYFNF